MEFLVQKLIGLVMTEYPLMLSRKQLVELTEFVQPVKQRARLHELGVPFISGKKGRPLVMRTVLEQWMSPGSRPRSRQPNFGAISGD